MIYGCSQPRELWFIDFNHVPREPVKREMWNSGIAEYHYHNNHTATDTSSQNSLARERSMQCAMHVGTLVCCIDVH